MTLQEPTSEEVFDLARRVAALLRALLYHPGTAFVEDDITDPKNTHPTLFNVTDFVQKTYLGHLIPLLPPYATKVCRALANPWAFRDASFIENTEAMTANKYPTIKGDPKLHQKWMDANSRAVMIAMIILDPKKQTMFGGEFDFGKVVRACAETLFKPTPDVIRENVVKLAALSGRQSADT